MTDELKELLERAKNHVATPEEKFLQKVSFVYGQMWDSPKTKQEIAQTIIDQVGYPLEWIELVK